MTPKVRSLFALGLILSAGCFAAYGCGSDEAANGTDMDAGADGANFDATTGLDGGNGTDSDIPTDGGDSGVILGDGSNGLCRNEGASCTLSTQCCSANCNGTSCGPPTGACLLPDAGCSSPTECCTVSCIGNKCGSSVCISDNQGCTTNASCCSGKCSSTDGGLGTCTPLSTTCLTSGNQCGSGALPCCSKLCTNGICSGVVSFCTQTGDSCSTSAQCCTGICNKALGATLGVCGTLTVPGGTQCTLAGQLCGASDAGVTDSGAPACGGECCSRACGPSYVSGVQICQPPSGCHPTGEICRGDIDCCGSIVINGDAGVLSNGSGSCSKANIGDPVGRCDNGNACRPLGAICKVPTVICSANAENNCCSGVVQNNQPETWVNCQQDFLGIPRCSGAGACTDADGGLLQDGGALAGKSCGSSADCCNLLACVPAADGGFVCGSGSCVPTDARCTTNGDCCPGNQCYIPGGATFGQCKPLGTSPDGGSPDGGSGSDGGSDGGVGDGGGCTSLYGQTCTVTADCCNNIPCITGRCRLP